MVQKFSIEKIITAIQPNNAVFLVEKLLINLLNSYQADCMYSIEKSSVTNFRVDRTFTIAFTTRQMFFRLAKR
jgi:hypothetical protein